MPSASTFNARVHLAWGDVAIREDGRMLRIFLKRSKTNQFMRGTEVFFGTINDDVYPVRAIRDYIARRGTSSGAFFQSAQGLSFTKACFVELVRSALTWAGVPVDGYSGHSFQIGAATAASEAGIPDSVIQALGHWTSPAFLQYIRTPREQLTQFPCAIGQESLRRWTRALALTASQVHTSIDCESCVLMQLPVCLCFCRCNDSMTNLSLNCLSCGYS